jgi:hypothetical protein
MTSPSVYERALMTVGQLEHQAAVTELFLFSAFRVLSGCDTPIAHAIYYTFDSFDGRRNLFNRIKKARLQFESYIKRLIKAGEIANELRREVAHALISLDQESITGKVTLLKIKTMKHQDVSHDYLDGLMARSSGALKDARAAYTDLCVELKVAPEVQVTS